MYSMEIDHMLSTFNLLEKRDTLSKALSGGMKRKLSIIIALMGGSQVLKKRGGWGGINHGFLPTNLENSADKNLRDDMNLKGILPMIEGICLFWLNCHNMVWDFFFL